MTIRKTIDFIKVFSETAGQAFALTAQYINEMGLFPMGGPIVCFHNQDLNACDVEMGWQTTQRVDNRDEILCTFVPSRKIASAIDLGPYKDSDPTLVDIYQWTKDNGYKTQGTIYNYYLNDPKRPQTEYLTQMVLPVK